MGSKRQAQDALAAAKEEFIELLQGHMIEVDDGWDLLEWVFGRRSTQPEGDFSRFVRGKVQEAATTGLVHVYAVERNFPQAILQRRDSLL
jgi:hypothetical protein